MSKFDHVNEGTFRKTAMVQARRWDPENPHHVTGWITAGGSRCQVLDGGRLGVGTLESGADMDGHTADPGDWVLQGPAGEFYVCKARVFAATYELVP